MAIILCKIAGVPIELHWTFILLFVIALLTSIGFLAILVALFAMVILHELAHALVSKRNGIRVKRIILMFLGGGTIIDQEAASPELAFRISLAGPLTSIILALLFGMAAIFAPAGIIRYSLQLLFEINILLGIFNILPAFPLDGGRILKSYLEKTRNNIDATKLAVRISKITLILFIIASVIYTAAFTSASLYDLYFVTVWDIIIIMFVYTGADAELEMAKISDSVKNLKVYEVMSQNFITIKPATKMRNVYGMLLRHKTNIVLFTKGNGIFIVNSGKKAFSQNLLDSKAENGAAEIPTVRKNDSIAKALGVMRYEQATILAVTSGRRIVGILTGDHLDSVIALHSAKASEEGRKGETSAK